MNTPHEPELPAEPAANTIASDPNFMLSLARGLAVLQAFSDQRRSLTIAQISHRTAIPRASVRRCLHTLIALGYASADGNQFSLKPK
ncbi:MAG: IclR family transcriptional regulator, partial [Oxalobacteraceae bacterium]